MEYIFGWKEIFQSATRSSESYNMDIYWDIRCNILV